MSQSSQVTLIDPTVIDDTALIRDRTTLDPEALESLQISLLAEGLRQPVEVWALREPTQTRQYGLISGLRRLTAFRNLAGINPSFDTIPAFMRSPADLPAAMAAMVTENEIRTQITPWEKGALIVSATKAQIFPTIDTAIAALFPAVSRQTRNRLRNYADVVDELGDALATPHLLTGQQIDRLAAALRGGLTALIHHILLEKRVKALPEQWAALLPTLNEALSPETDASGKTPGRPRRMMRLHQGLIIRREKIPHGWALRFTGPEARRGGMVDDVMDQIEYWYGRE